jgi:hypothetical protein
MALTLTTPTKGGKAPSAPTFVDVIKAVLDTSYPAGGYAITMATQLPGKVVLRVAEATAVIRASGNRSSRYAHWNADTGKLMLFVQTTGVEVAGAVDVSADDVYLTVISE